LHPLRVRKKEKEGGDGKRDGGDAEENFNYIRSHMKTHKFRIPIIGMSLVISLTAIFYFGCDDSAVTNSNTQFCISGTISNWTLGTKTLQARIYGRTHVRYEIANCPIDAGGNFNICLPVSLSDTALMAADSIFYSGCSNGNVTFNPPDTKGAELYDFRVKSGDTVKGFVKRNNYSVLFVGAFSVMYVYADKQVAVSGWKYCSGDTLNFDGTANLGWTKVIKNCTRTVGAGTTYLYNTTEPSGGIWKFDTLGVDLINEHYR
jgi:hypothetical protein